MQLTFISTAGQGLVRTPVRTDAASCSRVCRRSPPVAMAGGGRRRQKPARRRSQKPRDDIMDDNDVDSTSISTFVTCPRCANSLMVAPEKFLPKGGPLPLNCNVCESRVQARVQDLELVSGGRFNGNLFLARAAASVGTELPLAPLKDDTD